MEAAKTGRHERIFNSKRTASSRAYNRDLDKSRYYLPSCFVFLISPLIISSIQLLHKWALVAMDMSNGSSVLFDGAR